MFSNKPGSSKGILSRASSKGSFFRRKAKASTDEAGAYETPSKAPGKAGMKRQWTANGMPAPPPQAVVEEVVIRSASAVKVQSIIRGKSARSEVEGKKQQKKEEGQAASKIQAIKRGQRARADVADRRSSLSGEEGEAGLLHRLHACKAPLQKCTANMVVRLRGVLEGVQDGSSKVFGQPSKAMSEQGVADAR